MVSATAIRVAVIAFAMLLAAGCTSFQLHDARKSEVASAIATRYAAADVLGTIAIQKQNLAMLSAEELSAVRENAEIQRDFALLEIVDNDSSMAATWQNDIEPDIRRLGFENVAALRSYVQSEEVYSQVRGRQLDRLAAQIKDATGAIVPTCDAYFADAPEIVWPATLDGVTLDEEKLGRAKDRYSRYAHVCRNAVGDLESGALRVARAAWARAKAALEAKDADVAAAEAEVAEAKKAHKIAVAAATAAGKTGEELRRSVKASADALQANLAVAASLAPGVVADERIASITALLQAAAGDSVSTDGAPSESLAEAILVVNGVTSLAADIATLVAEAEAPSISNLIIEMQHQVILLEHAKALQSLELERVAIREARYRAFQAEASELLALHDAICSFGVLNAGSPHPEGMCDSFTAAVEDGVATCSIVDDPDANCDLSAPWKSQLSDPPNGATGREFYKSLTSFTRLFPIRASQIENNFRLVDLEHRRNLAAREMALKAWNNLVAIPIEQLDAYYASGLKPTEITDFLVKALGLTAIAIGVSD